MEYFMQFHWWYILVGIVLFFMVIGKSKGGVVVQRISADMQILDQRFQDCRPEAHYLIFKEGKPDKIDIEIEDLFLEEGEEIEFQLNASTLARVKVKRDREAEFEHWSDEGIAFPVVKAGDELVVKYQNIDVLKGTFHLV